MKKIIWLLLLFCGLLFSCTEKQEIVFDIQKDILVELDDYSASYSFEDYIDVFVNDEKVAYEDLTVTMSPGSSASLGVQNFIVSYEYNKKEYKKEFQVEFVDHYSNVKINLLKDIKEYRIENGKNLVSLNISNPSKYKIVGYYKDKNYTIEYNQLESITQDIEIYAKLQYDLEYSKPDISTENIVLNLDNYIENLMDSTPDYIPAWNKEGFKGRWNYIDGVFLNSIVNLYYETYNPRYKNFFLRYINYYIDADGDFINPSTQEKNGYRSKELDSVCESRILFDAYDMTKDERYLKAISKTYTELLSMPVAEGSNNYSHKESYLNQIWLDGMYMYVPFLARYGKINKNNTIFDQIKTQYEYIRRSMFDEEKKLYYHGHDTTKSIFWANKTTGNSQSFWLRSNGWFIVSLVDALEYFPEGENKEYLKGLLNEAIEGILQYKDEKTNMFYQLIDQGPTAYVVPKEYLSSLKNKDYGTDDAIIENYLETSGSSMVAYSLLKGSRLGYIKSEYRKAGKEIFEGIYGYSYKDGSLNHICITAGLGPASNQYRDGSISYYLAEPVGKDDAKGVGPFLMAYLEYAMEEEKLTKWYDVTFVRFDLEFIRTVPTGRDLSTIIDPQYPGYTFKGYYFDIDFQKKVPDDYKITKNEIIYLSFTKIPTPYDILSASDSVILKENFDSYTKDDTLPTFTAWGTKGIYSYIHDKNDPGVDVTLNHITLGDKTAYLYDNSENDGTQLIIDSGNVTDGIVKGYMEVELYNNGNQWTFFQMYGQRMDGTFGEIFGARFEAGRLQYRINGGSVITPEEWIIISDIWYDIEYTYDLNQKLLTVEINGVKLVKDLSMNLAQSFAGIKIVTSDGWVHNSYGDLFHRTARVDNVVIVVEE